MKILEEIKEILIKNDLKIACAESCTGGLVSSYLTDISGSSAYIEQNFVTYSNRAKINILNVKEETLEKFGAVSFEVAYQMTLGLLNYAPCSLATTGILGPTGGSKQKPVGLCYIGFGILCKGEPVIKIVKFQSGIVNSDANKMRVEIKEDIARNALINLIGFLKENVATCKET